MEKCPMAQHMKAKKETREQKKKNVLWQNSVVKTSYIENRH